MTDLNYRRSKQALDNRHIFRRSYILRYADLILHFIILSESTRKYRYRFRGCFVDEQGESFSL